MVPRLVPEISPLDAFCDGAAGAGGAAGIGDSRSWIGQICRKNQTPKKGPSSVTSKEDEMQTPPPATYIEEEHDDVTGTWCSNLDS